MHSIIVRYKTSGSRRAERDEAKASGILDHPTADPLKQVFGKTAGEKALDAERGQGP